MFQLPQSGDHYRHNEFGWIIRVARVIKTPCSDILDLANPDYAYQVVYRYQGTEKLLPVLWLHHHYTKVPAPTYGCKGLRKRDNAINEIAEQAANDYARFL